jgi:3-hydroxyacyl-CoA dehydrogenase
MGSGIAQVAAVAGLNVMLCDSSPVAIQAGADALTVSLQNLVSQHKMSAPAAEAAALRIVRSTDVQVSSLAVQLLCSWMPSAHHLPGSIPDLWFHRVSD